MRWVFVSIAVVALGTGCASLVSDSEYIVTIASDPPGASAVVRDENQAVIRELVTPGHVKLPASDGYMSGATYYVEATLEGHRPAHGVIESSLDGWYWGNLLFGGFVGMLIFDPATGAMFKLDPGVMLRMQPEAVTAAP